MDTAAESVNIAWFLLLWTKWTSEETTMLESAELQRPGKAFVFSFGKVKDDASPQVHAWVSSISIVWYVLLLIGFRAEQSEIRLSLQSVSGSILPVVFGQRALDLENLGRTWTMIYMLPEFAVMLIVPLLAFIFHRQTEQSSYVSQEKSRLSHSCVRRCPDRCVFQFLPNFADSPDMSCGVTICLVFMFFYRFLGYDFCVPALRCCMYADQQMFGMGGGEGESQTGSARKFC